jgi:CxxC-x17-CxxC domain-containing protein
MSLSPFGYNETVANEFYPLERGEALKVGAKWSDYEMGAQFHGEKVTIPDTIDKVNDEILNKILTCEGSGKPYRVIARELDFYRKRGVPVPLRSPNQRHKDRLALRNPRELFERKCAKCGSEIQTTYAPGRPENVYCEECYLKEVY